MNRFLATVILSVIITVPCIADQWLTFYERSGFLETPRYAETVDFCRALAAQSPIVRYGEFGVSPQGRPLPLLIVDKDREFDRRGVIANSKVVLLVQAGIHSGEIEGKDAGLMFIRDIAVRGRYHELLDNVILLFIPIFNVDGHERFGPYHRINQNGPKEMGWRTTAQNLNLNRDFAKADLPEMRAWLQLFNRWLPDFLVDVHTTNGADYQYIITYGIEYNTNVAPPLAQWTSDVFLPYIRTSMENAGYPFVPYIVPKTGHDVTKGLMSWTGGPRFSNGYGAVQNRPFLLIETHMLKPYRQRVESVYELMRQLTAYLNGNAWEYKRVIAVADSVTANHLVGSYFPLRFRPAPDSVMIDFLGVDFRFEHSDISGAERIVWGNEKVTYSVPLFHRNIAADSAQIPYAYLIPQEWKNVIDILQLHGVKITRLTKDTTLEVESYRFHDVAWDAKSFEGRQGVSAQRSLVVERRSYPANTAVVIMNQRTNCVAAHLLEPGASDSFFRWGFFNTILEEKEYAEDYVIEELARTMLADDPQLRQEFESRLATDSTFAASPNERLRFFYERSPWFDQKLNLYPVGKVMQEAPLPLQ